MKTPILNSAVPVFLLAAWMLAGCANTRFVENPLPPGVDLDLGDGNEFVEVSLRHIIVSGGPASWVKQAGWDEYIFEVRNLSTDPVTIENIQLIDPTGRYLENSLQPEQLERLSETLLQDYRDAGIAVAIGAAPTVVAGAGVAAGSLGAAAGAAVLAPVAVVAAPLVYFSNRQARQEDKERIEAEFMQRRITRVTISGNGTVRGSAFFPIVPNPRALVFDYRQGSDTGVFELSLEGLSVNVAQ